MLVRVKQAVRFYKVFIIKIEGGGEVYTLGEVITKMNKYKWDEPNLQQYVAGQIQVTRCFKGC